MLCLIGPVQELVPKLATYELQCPPYHNPADFAIDIASGDYGEEVLAKMAEDTFEKKLEFTSTKLAPADPMLRIKVSTAIDAMTHHRRLPFFRHLGLLLLRTLITTLHDPVLNFARLLQHLFLAIVISVLYKESIGEEDGCIHSNDYSNSSSIGLSLDLLQEKQMLASQNVAFFFFSLIFLSFCACMPTLLVLPLEMTVFLKVSLDII